MMLTWTMMLTKFKPNSNVSCGKMLWQSVLPHLKPGICQQIALRCASMCTHITVTEHIKLMRLHRNHFDKTSFFSPCIFDVKVLKQKWQNIVRSFGLGS